MEEANSDRSPKNVDFWGDDIETTDKKDTLRILSVNINGFPKHTNHPKYGILRQAITSNKTDIIGFSEVNIKWDRLYPTNRMKQRIASWWQNSPHCSYAYNYKDLSKAVYQPGGTAILSMNSATSRVTRNTLSDPEGLGRWTSTVYNGKNNQKVRIVQVYCPALPTEISNNSTYAQHHRYFLTKNITDCPRKLFFTHLRHFITERFNEQERLIIMGDFNHHLESPPMVNFVSSLNLHNIHKTLHMSFNPNIPTFNRGSQTIDAIFASQGISAIKGGFLDFDHFPTDHRALWGDLDISATFGHISPMPHTPQKRRLQCEDPRAVEKFCSEYKALIKKSDLTGRVNKLMESISGTLTVNQRLEYESIDKLRIETHM